MIAVVALILWVWSCVVVIVSILFGLWSWAWGQGVKGKHVACEIDSGLSAVKDKWACQALGGFA